MRVLTWMRVRHPSLRRCFDFTGVLVGPDAAGPVLPNDARLPGAGMLRSLALVYTKRHSCIDAGVSYNTALFILFFADSCTRAAPMLYHCPFFLSHSISFSLDIDVDIALSELASSSRMPVHTLTTLLRYRI